MQHSPSFLTTSFMRFHRNHYSKFNNNINNLISLRPLFYKTNQLPVKNHQTNSSSLSSDSKSFHPISLLKPHERKSLSFSLSSSLPLHNDHFHKKDINISSLLPTITTNQNKSQKFLSQSQNPSSSRKKNKTFNLHHLQKSFFSSTSTTTDVSEKEMEEKDEGKISYSTPAMKQYGEIKAQYKDHIVLFQLGEFYEMFDEDAKWATTALGLSISSRKPSGILMTGVPVHLLELYVTKILQRGRTICICDQMGRPKKGEIISRKVTRIVSPGTAIEIDYLRPRQHNFLCCISLLPSNSPTNDQDTPDAENFGLCWLDMSTGEIKYSTSSKRMLQSDLLRISPSEVLLCGDLPEYILQFVEPYCVTQISPPGTELTDKFRECFLKGEHQHPDPPTKTLEQTEKNEERGESLRLKDKDVTQLTEIILSERPIEEYLQEQPSLHDDGLPLNELESAFGEMNEVEKMAMLGVLSYVRNAMPNQHSLSLRLPEHDSKSVMKLDFCTKQSLEFLKCNSPDARNHLFQADGVSADGNGPGRKYRSLLSALDMTITPGGGRLLSQDLSSPLASSLEINRRLDAVEYLIRRPQLVKRLRAILKQTHDIERCIQRVSLGRGSSRDMLSVGLSLKKVKEIKQEFFLDLDTLAEGQCDRPYIIDDLLKESDALPAISELLVSALALEPPLLASAPGHIADGFCAGLDRLRDLSKSGHSSIQELLNSLKAQTSISSLKISRNNMFGFFLQVPKQIDSNLIPNDWRHIQTHPKALRYRNAELQALETSVNDAASSAQELEHHLLSRLRSLLLSHLPSLRMTSAALSRLDVLLSWAHLIEERGYKRPEIEEHLDLEIIGGRHPVVELYQEPHIDFVPNDCSISHSDDRMWIITGPNMAGKSTFLRQTAIIVIMAQMGGYVPADKARIGVADAIFSRVGSSADNLQANRSTFMAEMSETASILSCATHRSLVLMDEIGRGTSPFDGSAIAASVIRYLHNDVKCRTLFATHFHQLPLFASEHLPKASPHCVAIHDSSKMDTSKKTDQKSSANIFDTFEETKVSRSPDREGVLPGISDLAFTFRVVPGVSLSSYGLHCARLAGLPLSVIHDAFQMMETKEESLEQKLMSLDVESLSPSEALSLLKKWKA